MNAPDLGNQRSRRVAAGKSVLGKAREVLEALLTRRMYLESDGIPYTFDNVPLRKVVNWVLTEASMCVMPGIPWGWPTHLQVEPTALCNLRCTLCPVTTGMDRDTGNMEFAVFKQLLDDAGRYGLVVHLWDWGEPFVNPEVYDMIAYAKQYGLKVISSSNGHAFAEEEQAQKLVQSGIDSIIIAIDGITQHTYERYRQHGRLETALTGVRNVLSEKRCAGGTMPLVNLRFLAMAHNEHEIPALIDLAQSLDVDVLSIKTLNPYSSDMYAENRDQKRAFYDSFVPHTDTYRRFQSLDEGSRPHRVKRDPPCKNLWNSPSVHWDGTVCSCTYDYKERHVLGNLTESSFRDIWFGESYRQLRRQFRSNWEGIQLCASCSYAYEGGSCATETIAEVYFNPRHREVFMRAAEKDGVRPRYTALDVGQNYAT
jgi:radical SAM protein with 4Fe4S-binding SPASM domain